MRFSIAVAFLVSTVIISASYATAQAASFPCTNPSPATQAQVDASNGGLKLGQSVCPQDAQLGGITNDAGVAKAYLLSIARNLRNSQAPPDKAHIDALNNSFATCAAQFLRAYIGRYGPVNVVSAFRCGPNSPASINCDRTENGRAGGASNSNHQLGLAMDINLAGGNSSYETLRSFAQANPGYGVTFPWPFYNGSIDKPHMQAVNKSNASCSGVNGTPVTPGDGTVPPQSQLSNAIRQALGMQQPPMPPQPQLPPQPTPSPQPQAQTQPTLPGQPNISSESPQPNPVSNLINTNTNTNTSSNTNTTNTASSTATSTFDLIDAYLNPVSDSIDIGKAVDIALNPDTSDATSLNGERPTSTAMNATGTLALSQTVIAPQTFTSNDLAKNPIAPNVAGQNTFVLQILDSMKKVLLVALTYLKPFGGYTPAQYQSE